MDKWFIIKKMSKLNIADNVTHSLDHVTYELVILQLYQTALTAQLLLFVLLKSDKFLAS